ncbi:MAG: hypothetical protein K6F52_04670 [Clostridia bacterium]|nr:hypothetical protein [Clostridia bacterium]
MQKVSGKAAPQRGNETGAAQKAAALKTAFGRIQNRIEKNLTKPKIAIEAAF